MFTALTPFARGIAMAGILVSLAVAAGRAPAAHASGGGSGPVVCTVCPVFPGSPTLSPLQQTANNKSVLIKGQGFSSWGGIDLYVWKSYDPGVDAGSFAGTIHTTAQGSALAFRLSPLVYTGPHDRKVICLGDNAIYVVAVDDSTHFSSGVRALNLGCYALSLPAVTAKQSLHVALKATKGAITVTGRHYTPHTSIAVYLLPNGLPMLVPGPTTLTASGSQFATTMYTGHLGCSDALSWTTFALDQAANVASPLRTVQDLCTVPIPPK